jgi:membrane-associated phospholipid phosphatase
MRMEGDIDSTDNPDCHGTPVRIYFPAERSLAAYLILAGVSIVALRPDAWVPLGIGHIAAAVVVAWIARRPGQTSLVATGIRGTVPLLLFAVLYPMTGRINSGMTSWVLDGPIEKLEGMLFGGQPSLYLSERLPSLFLSEFLHGCYFGYYLLVVALGVTLAAQRRHREMSFCVGIVCTCFFVCLLCYIWLPSRSPLYLYPLIGPPLTNGFFYELTHSVARQGGVIGGAFPSSHAAVSFLNLLLAYRWARVSFFATLVPTAGLLFATVYCRYHFALDTIAGMLVAACFFMLSIRLEKRSGVCLLGTDHSGT